MAHTLEALAGIKVSETNLPPNSPNLPFLSGKDLKFILFLGIAY